MKLIVEQFILEARLGSILIEEFGTKRRSIRKLEKWQYAMKHSLLLAMLIHCFNVKYCKCKEDSLDRMGYRVELSLAAKR